jgi:hypothetical protein
MGVRASVDVQVGRSGAWNVNSRSCESRMVHHSRQEGGIVADDEYAELLGLHQITRHAGDVPVPRLVSGRTILVDAAAIDYGDAVAPDGGGTPVVHIKCDGVENESGRRTQAHVLLTLERAELLVRQLSDACGALRAKQN